jgi:hypothetical protein
MEIESAELKSFSHPFGNRATAGPVRKVGPDQQNPDTALLRAAG